ncbi:MAG: tRNA preQ1(34) S-adenosylmethionine ribosyltransferase-isomerase QueA [Ruminococcaceae bacterium]|nr:tRNA preQ1(34) S-adenosylmethionine ribosyltransferase-isomerase QueA [Oscillospiraceae bacterium]
MSTNLKKSDFYFDLPEELIAQTPIEKRDTSRLMVVDKTTGEVFHKHFYDIIDYLNEGDCLVVNNTRVIPARLLGNRGTGGAIEVLLLKDLGDDNWECLVYPGKKLREGAKVVFGEGLLKGEIIKVQDDGNRVIHFTYDGIFLEILDKLGMMPLPHYIKAELGEKERYQTVYSKHNGSAAAPTAGLHFTNELLDKIRAKGIKIAEVTLHVGIGTFRPVKAENITDHHMHSEHYEVSEETAKLINDTRKAGGRIVAVGTTSCRTLESATDENHITKAGGSDTSIFIYPGYTFKGVDAIITNFHLPESTLIMLISAFSDRERILNAYKQAVEERYRFFSFGDAMYIADLK